MSSYLACITSSTGVPLFVRSYGDVPQLSFPVVGSLNGVHWFTSNAKASLLSCVSGDVKIVWRDFHDCLTLILICSNDSPTDCHQWYLLELIFNAMVLILGLQELLSIDVENLKREMRCCFPLIDLLLGNQEFISPLTRGVEVVYNQEQKSLIDSLESFTSQVHSGYGCLSVMGRVLNATESWWQLDAQEIILLSLFPSSLPSSQCTDIPVYLPKASNTIAHRLLIFQLVEGVDLMVMCDSEPSLAEAQEIVRTFWTPIKDRFSGLSLQVPRCLPLRISFDKNILGLCLVNLSTHQTILSLLSSENQESTATLLSRGYQGALNVHMRRKYLLQFYKTVVDDLLPVDMPHPLVGEEDCKIEGNLDKSNAVRTRLFHKITETYTCTKGFKAYAIHKDKYNLFVLFNITTPTYALRKLSHDSLDSLIDSNVL